MPKHEDHRLLPYRPDQLYDLVVDVERYPEFLPWCIGARIRERRPTEIVADLVIGFKMYRERFTSHVTLEPPGSIAVTYSEGPFRYLNNAWRFTPAPGGACQVDFHVDFELRSKLLQGMLDLVFGEAIRRMVSAFEARARTLYGTGPATAPPATLIRDAG